MHAPRLTFEEQGFVQLRQVFSAEEVAEIRQALQRYQDEVAPRLPEREWARDRRRPGNPYIVLDRICFHDPFFAALAEDPRITGLAATLLGEPTRRQPIQFFNVLSGDGHHTPPHQDAFIYKTTRSASLNIWLPLTDVDERKGCLRYVPGSHSEGRRLHAQRGGRGPFVVEPFSEQDMAREVCVPATAGDLLAHHGLTIHRSSCNVTGDERWALGFPFLAVADATRLSPAAWLATATDGAAGGGR